MEVVRGAPRWEGSTDTGLEKGCRGHCSKCSVSIQTLIDTVLFFIFVANTWVNHGNL